MRKRIRGLVAVVVYLTSVVVGSQLSAADKDNLAFFGNKLDYGKVFNQDEVIRIEIEIEPTVWSLMQADLDANLASKPEQHPMREEGDRGGGPPPSGQMPPSGGRMPPPGRSGNDDQVRGGNDEHPMHNGDHKEALSSENPMWGECSVTFNGLEWQHVGVRYKGNSSLMSAHRANDGKYSFKLDFDQFEKEFPEIKNQRFYGFKQLNLNNNFKDASLMHEKVASDLFRDFGVPSAKTTLCELYLDNGSGLQLVGIYTLVEEVDNTVIKSQFTSNKGNLYKPEMQTASFAEGGFDREAASLKTNKKRADYSDIELLYETVNSDLRNEDADAWRSKLESIFDVTIFLKWMAANSVMQNWDTYGNMSHNYYLYNNPETALLTWIPWDNNEALQEQRRGAKLEIGFAKVGNDWPLIRYILDQEEYKERYNGYVREFSEELFYPERMNKIYDKYYQMLKPFEQKGLEKAVERQKEHVESRLEAVLKYLK